MDEGMKASGITAGHLIAATTTTTTEGCGTCRFIQDKTVEIAKVRGFSVDVLESIRDSGGLTVDEIASKYRKEPDAVRVTLHRLRKYGLIFLSICNNEWIIDPFAIDIVNSKIEHNRSITEALQKHNRNITQYKQFTLKPWQSDRTEFEVVVVEYLLQHFKETQSKWMWKYEIDPEKIGIPPSELNKAFLKLLSSKIVWKYRDRDTQILKYGLTDTFLEGYQYI
jgi:hypothetical protein